MKKIYLLIWTLVATVSFAPRMGHAVTVFSDGFQDGSYDDWTIGAEEGRDAANEFEGNWTMLLAGARSGTIAVSTAGLKEVSLSMDIAALNLVSSLGDACFAEYSVDGGGEWTELVSVGADEADGFFRNGTVTGGLDDNPDLLLRFRAFTFFYAEASVATSACYGDNVFVSGRPLDSGNGPTMYIDRNGRFGSVEVGMQASKTITITNDGGDGMEVRYLKGLKAPFAIANDGCTSQDIAPGDSCTFDILFAPDKTTDFSDYLKIRTNDSKKLKLRVDVSGNGVPAGFVYGAHAGDGNVARTKLTYEDLMAPMMVGDASATLVDYSHYAVPMNAANPGKTFTGTLELYGEDSAGNAEEVSDGNLLQYYPGAEHLPEFAFDYVQLGTHLIPMSRGKLEGNHGSWAYVLEAGRVWDEVSDNGYSRASLPFSLQERNNDCMWNGVLTFLFKSDGSISDVSYQFAADTCEYMKVNFWGRLDAAYSPGLIDDALQVRADYETEVARRMPVKPIAALATDYPGNGVITANIGADAPAEDMTLYGVAYKGIHYTGGCKTRFGDYPFCEVMNVPSYSTAKSVNAGYGLMLLERKFGGKQRELPIGDYVSECSGPQWQIPTLENALDMTTGNFDSSANHADEGAASKLNNFFLQNTHAAKVDFACAYPQKIAPGTEYVYHTSDTYLLGRAMNTFYQSQANGGPDFYDDVLVEEVYKPLGLSPTTFTSLRTQDLASQPHSGYGMIFVRDDVVKLAELLGEQKGKINKKQVLDSRMVKDTLKLKGDEGFEAGFPSLRYNNGFYYFDLQQATMQDYGCKKEKWIPYMSGFGGITVVLLPNDMVYYHFSDAGNAGLGWGNAAAELDKISALCR